MKKIIISRTDSIGDVILTLPLCGYLKKIYPNIEIVFIGRKYTEAIILKSSFVDRFLDKDQLIETPSPNPLEEIQADVIIFAFPDKEIAMLAKNARIPLRIGTSHRWFHWLYCNRRVSFSRKNSTLHEAQLNFKLLAPLGIQYLPEINEIPSLYGLTVNPESKTKFKAFLKKGLINIILHPKSKGSARDWQLNNYFKLLESVPKHHFHFFISGTAQEGEQIRREFKEIFLLPFVTDMTGKFSLNDFIDFIAAADGLIACSTGPLHIAAALGKKAIGIYPPMKPIHPGRWMPIGKEASYLSLEKDCQECRKTMQCACINAITPYQVAAKLEALHKNHNIQSSEIS